MRIGLFGGTFDPVHAGHLYLARAARRAGALDELVFVPAARPPHKPGRALADGADRAAMLRIALCSLGFGQVSELELARAGLSYTIDTVRALSRPGAEIALVIGADNLPGLPDWRSAEDLLAAVEPIVFARGDEPAVAELLSALAGRLSERALGKLAAGLVPVAPVSASSTELRRALEAGEPCGALLPAGVGEYIGRRGLYRAAP